VQRRAHNTHVWYGGWKVSKATAPTIDLKSWSQWGDGLKACCEVFHIRPRFRRWVSLFSPLNGALCNLHETNFKQDSLMWVKCDCKAFNQMNSDWHCSWFLLTIFGSIRTLFEMHGSSLFCWRFRIFSTNLTYWCSYTFPWL